MDFFVLPRSKITVAGPTVGDARMLLSSTTLLCLDTSALLEVLRMSNSDADLFLDTLESLKDRVVVPPTVAAEVRDLGLQKIEEAINTEMLTAKHPGHFFDKPRGAGAEYHDEFVAGLLAVSENYRKKVRADIERRFERILRLLDDCRGPELPPDVRLRVLADAPARYSRNQPPGYTDAGKIARGDVAFNDVLLFFEMIHVARQRSADVAFITNEAKEDWWEIDPLISPRRLIRGRPELSREFRAEASRAFAVFHGLRLVEDLTGLRLLFSQIPEVFAQWQRQAELWTGSQLQRLQQSIDRQWDWSNKFSNLFGLAGMDADLKRYQRLTQQTSGLHGITRMNMEIKRYERMMQQATSGILGVSPSITPFTKGMLPPSISQIVNPLNFGTREFAVPGIARALGLDKLSPILSATNPIRGIMNAFQIPDTARILRDMTFNVSALALPYMDQVQALIADARIPGVLPAVGMLDDLSRPAMPKKRRDAAALRRMHSHRRRTLRRTLRGRRINLLDKNLPLRRVLKR